MSLVFEMTLEVLVSSVYRSARADSPAHTRRINSRIDVCSIACRFQYELEIAMSRPIRIFLFHAEFFQPMLYFEFVKRRIASPLLSGRTSVS